MRSLFALLLVGFGSAAAAPVPKDFKKPNDQARLVGTWKTRVLHLNGQVQTEITTHTFGFAADGKCHTLYGAGNRSDWTYTLDPTATPKRMKWVNDRGNSTFDCVYELTGDMLKLGFIGGGKPAPAKVEPGPDLTLYEMTREK